MTARDHATLVEKVSEVILRGIGAGEFTGATVAASLRGEAVVQRAYGDAYLYESLDKRSGNPIPAREDTLFDVASITKLFTATCLVQLVEEGRVGLDDAVAAYLPDFGRNGKADRTVRQLLTHTAGLAPYEHLWEYGNSVEEYVERTLSVKPVSDAEQTYVYSDIGLITLGLLIEAVDGRSLARSVQARILDPLEMRRTAYNPLDRFRREEMAATEDEGYIGRGMVWGEVHDENAWCLGGVAGHAGLFSTAPDLLRFGELFLNEGTYKGRAIIGADSVREMVRNQIGRLGSRGLGWQLDAPFYMGRFSSEGAFGHTGFTGTSLFVAPRRDLVAVLLTNRVHPTRNGPDLTPTRRGFADALHDALG